LSDFLAISEQAQELDIEKALIHYSELVLILHPFIGVF